MTITIMVSGTARNMPIGPQTQRQKSTERMITSVEIPKRFPRSIGSTKFPSEMLMMR